MVQLSHLYMATGKTIALTIWTFVSKVMSLLLNMLSNHLIFCRCPLLLLPSIFPSIRVFSNELALCIRWPKYWSFSFSISPSNEYSGLISFRIDWFDLLAVQGTLKKLIADLGKHGVWILIFPLLWPGRGKMFVSWGWNISYSLDQFGSLNESKKLKESPFYWLHDSWIAVWWSSAVDPESCACWLYILRGVRYSWLKVK